jgi:hypothetical protein
MIVSPGGEVRLIVGNSASSDMEHDVADELTRHFGAKHA